MEGGVTSVRTEGTPQGGPLSPLLSNILLTDLDRELERRRYRFCRYVQFVTLDSEKPRAVCHAYLYRFPITTGSRARASVDNRTSASNPDGFVIHHPPGPGDGSHRHLPKKTNTKPLPVKGGAKNHAQ